MYIVAILYCLGINFLVFYFLNISYPCLVESMDMKPSDMEGYNYICQVLWKVTEMDVNGVTVPNLKEVSILKRTDR